MLAVDIISLTVFYQFKITDNKTGFYYQNSFGKCKRYEYTEISCFSIGRAYIFYLQEKKDKIRMGTRKLRTIFESNDREAL